MLHPWRNRHRGESLYTAHMVTGASAWTVGAVESLTALPGGTPFRQGVPKVRRAERKLVIDTMAIAIALWQPPSR